MRGERRRTHPATFASVALQVPNRSASFLCQAWSSLRCPTSVGLQPDPDRFFRAPSTFPPVDVRSVKHPRSFGDEFLSLVPRREFHSQYAKDVSTRAHALRRLRKTDLAVRSFSIEPRSVRQAFARPRCTTVHPTRPAPCDHHLPVPARPRTARPPGRPSTVSRSQARRPFDAASDSRSRNAPGPPGQPRDARVEPRGSSSADPVAGARPRMAAKQLGFSRGAARSSPGKGTKTGTRTGTKTGATTSGYYNTHVGQSGSVADWVHRIERPHRAP
jgi:hypothetical protein